MLKNTNNKDTLNKIVSDLMLIHVSENPAVLDALNTFISICNSEDYSSEDDDQRMAEIFINHSVRSGKIDHAISQFTKSKAKIISDLNSSIEFKNSSDMDKESMINEVLDESFRHLGSLKQRNQEYLKYRDAAQASMLIMSELKFNEMGKIYSRFGNENSRFLINLFTYQYNTKAISIGRVNSASEQFSLAKKLVENGVLKQGVIDDYSEALGLLKVVELGKYAKELGIKFKSGLLKEEKIFELSRHPDIPETFKKFMAMREVFSLINTVDFGKEKLISLLEFIKYYELIVEEIKGMIAFPSNYND